MPDAKSRWKWHWLLPVWPTSWWGGTLLLAPLLLWFSYQPIIRLGRNASMNFELSLALIYVAVLGVISLGVIWRERRHLKGNWLVYLVAAFTLYSAVSVVWSSNRLRGVLVAGVTALLAVAVIALKLRQAEVKRLLPSLRRLLMVGATVVAVLAIGQFVGGIWWSTCHGQPNLWLCLGCTVAQFGFVRPNGLAIEPQFLGNLMLLPSLLILWRYLNRQAGRLELGLLLLYLVIIFLTLSRGAIYALGLGFMVLWALHYRQWRRGLVSAGWLVLAFIVSLWLQCVAAQLSQYHVSWYDTTSRVVEQLSLNKIKLPKRAAPVVSPAPVSTQPAPRYSGYVAESTNVRVAFSHDALAIWRHNLTSQLFGTGLGSFGVELAKLRHSTWTKEIVQNEFIEVLQERGLVGLLLLLGLIGYLIWREWRSSLMLALLAAFAAQYCFFSGLPNALHVFIALGILFSATSSQHLPKGLKENA